MTAPAPAPTPTAVEPLDSDLPLGRVLRPGQRCRVWTSDLAGRLILVHESDEILLEAPNWTPDGRLVLNGDGRLWTLPAEPSVGSTPTRPELIRTELLPAVNNDHALSPDGLTVYASADDGHVHAVPLAGGAARRVTADDGRLHFLHGVSPDGRTLAYVALETGAGGGWADWAPTAHVRLIGVRGEDDRRLTTRPGPDDGAEYSPDGAWVLYNTEAFTAEPGHAQIARIPAAGGEPERLSHGPSVDWFPHVAPDGRHATYLAYPPGTTGHPEDLDVEVRVVALTGPDGVGAWDEPVAVIPLHGGQGTINVGSWSPDGTRFALVDYPLG